MHYPIPVPRLVEGQKVRAKAFTDCSGRYHPEISGLTVARVQVQVPAGGLLDTLTPWYRVTTQDDRGYTVVEAAERFFAEEVA